MAPRTKTVPKAPPAEPLLTRSEVAALFGVDPKTVTQWAIAGKLSTIRTLGGHRRYLQSEVVTRLLGNAAGTLS